MKSYTDIEQSKKLMNILPLESADMAWYPSFAKEGYSIRMLNDTYPLDIIGEEYDEIPAWSLAALLDILPDTMLGKDKDGYVVMTKTMGSSLTAFASNSVDVCYEIILKLNEQKLL